MREVRVTELTISVSEENFVESILGYRELDGGPSGVGYLYLTDWRFCYMVDDREGGKDQIRLYFEQKEPELKQTETTQTEKDKT